MSAHALTWAWTLSGYSPAAKLLAVWIADNCGSDHGETVVRVGTACAFCNLSEGALAAALAELTASGLQVGPNEAGVILCRLPLSPRQAESKAPTRRHEATPGHLYVVTAGGKTKVGISRDIENRLGWLQSGNPNPITVALRLPGTMRDVRAIEQEVHQRLASHRVAGEWFDVSPEAAIEVVHAVAAEITNNKVK